MVDNESLFADADVHSLKSDYFAVIFRSKMGESIEMVVEVLNCPKAAFSQAFGIFVLG